jgi:hypothetical protein
VLDRGIGIWYYHDIKMTDIEKDLRELGERGEIVLRLKNEGYMIEGKIREILHRHVAICIALQDELVVLFNAEMKELRSQLGYGYGNMLRGKDEEIVELRKQLEEAKKFIK